MNMNRRNIARDVRIEAADLAHQRDPAIHATNGDEGRYAAANYAMSFTKGLAHNSNTLLLDSREAFHKFRRAIDDGYVLPFSNIEAPVFSDPADRRKWEAPTAGHVYSLEGPDAQAVTMAPPPALGSLELTYEMAEVYELALLRDVDFRDFANGSTENKVEDACKRLNALASPDQDFPTRKRHTNDKGEVTAQTLFRGSTPGVETGPYLSQFLHIGNGPIGGTSGMAIDPVEGRIGYGAQRINQKVPVAESGKDYLQDEASYLDAQNGKAFNPTQEFTGVERFIRTPRDLATYVHFDALYQAYLNACLILLAQGAPFDQKFDHLSGMGLAGANRAGGFALWGGPHILTLVTEVATRALKAVRYQKFNNHLRLRPEALAARVHKASTLETHFPVFMGKLTSMRDALDKKPKGVKKSLLKAIRDHNGGTELLPMAFAEGSPMHPSYGAGHATVAGACVTILKLFFDTSAVLVRRGDDVGFKLFEKNDQPVQYVLQDDDTLTVEETSTPLTLEGELNKLAANISIGRNMAGVHFYSDYYDSLRMGEEIAVGLIEEQALCYRKDPFAMSLRCFDDERGEIMAPETTGYLVS